MEKEQSKFEKIAKNLSIFDSNVRIGKMMSSPGIRYQDKFFAFYYDKEMVFRLGKDAEPKKLGISKFNLLNPFKTKAPLKNWFQVPYSENKHWEKLARYALGVLSKELKETK